MAYFSNGTEGDMYAERWCDRCVHQEPGCMVWLLHMLYNYDDCNNKESMLHRLIPIRDDGFADKCSMFYERTNDGSARTESGESDGATGRRARG